MKSCAKLHKKQLFSTIAGLVALLLTSTSLCAAEHSGMTEEQKTFYAIGQSVARSLTVFELTPAEFELVKQGLTDAQTGKKSYE